jgi:hypothetical protein
MDDAGFMGGLKTHPGGEVDVEYLLGAQLAGGLCGAQGLAAHEFHGEENLFLPRPDVEDGDDVGVRKPRHGLGFGEQLRAAGAGGGGAKVWPQ